MLEGPKVERSSPVSHLILLVHLMLSLLPTSLEAHSTPLETLQDTFEARQATLGVTETPPLSVGIPPSLILLRCASDLSRFVSHFQTTLGVVVSNLETFSSLRFPRCLVVLGY